MKLRKLLACTLAAAVAFAGALAAYVGVAEPVSALAADIPTDYDAYFSFDETLADETGSYTAVSVGAALSGTDKTDADWTYEEGQVGSAIRINSDGDDVGLNTGVDLGSTSYTIAFLAKADSSEFATPIVWAGRTDQSTESWNGFWSGFDGAWDNTEQVGLGSNDADGQRIGITPSTTLNDASDSGFGWTAIAWTVDLESDTATLYYGGVEVGQVTGLAALEDEALVYIGANAWDNPCNFAIDELYIYKYALTADEIAAIAEAGGLTEEEPEPVTEHYIVDISAVLDCYSFDALGHVYTDAAQLTVTYEDGSTAEITYEDGTVTDSYGNVIYGDWGYTENRTQTEVSFDVWIHYSAYSGKLCTAVSEDYAVEVPSIPVTEIELLSQTYSTEMDGTNLEALYFTYTPSEDGQYYFVMSLDGSEDLTEESTGVYSDGDTVYYCWNAMSLEWYNEDAEEYYLAFPVYEDGYGYMYYDPETGEYACTEDYSEDTAGDRAWVFELEAGTTYYIIDGYYAYNSSTDENVPGTVNVTAEQVDHEHSYTETWTWADDYSAATLTLTCTTCTETVTMEAEVTSVTTEATETEDGEIVYTATATCDGVTYTDTKTVVLAAIGEVETTAADETETTAEEETTTSAAEDETTADAAADTSGTDSDAADDTDSSTGSTDGESTKTSDSAPVAALMIVLFGSAAAVVVTVSGKKRETE